MNHKSDCAVHNKPAYLRGRCDCGLLLTPEEVSKIVDLNYDADPWECAKASVEEAIELQLDRILASLKEEG